MDEERAREVLEVRKALCFYRKPREHTTTTIKEIYRARMSNLIFKIPDYDFYYNDDLVATPVFYIKNEFYEDWISSPGYYFSQLLNYELPFEDYDHSLPDNRNLWKVMTNENPTELEKIRMTLSAGWDFTNNYSETDKKTLEKLLNNREAFEWYYSIMTRLNFPEKVQVRSGAGAGAGAHPIQPRYILIDLFRLFGPYFVLLFATRPERATTRSMMFISKDILPMKQITFGYVDRILDSSSGYRAIITMLNEIGRARGWLQ